MATSASDGAYRRVPEYPRGPWPGSYRLAIIDGMPEHLVRRPPHDRRSRWYAWVTRGASGARTAVLAMLAGGTVLGATVVEGSTAVHAELAIGTGAVIAYLAAWPLLARLLQPREEYERAISDDPGRADLARAAAAVRRITLAWPHLGALVDEPAQPTLDEALWHLAGDLLQRAEVRAARVEIEQVITELPEGDPELAALSSRADDLSAINQRLDAEVATQVDRLERLADECARHLITQAAQERVESATRRADSLLSASRPELAAEALATPDPAAELAERTSAVLGAYRELRAGVSA
jgi:hypothetical protein